MGDVDRRLHWSVMPSQDQIGWCPSEFRHLRIAGADGVILQRVVLAACSTASVALPTAVGGDEAPVSSSWPCWDG